VAGCARATATSTLSLLGIDGADGAAAADIVAAMIGSIDDCVESGCVADAKSQIVDQLSRTSSGVISPCGTTTARTLNNVLVCVCRYVHVHTCHCEVRGSVAAWVCACIHVRAHVSVRVLECMCV
jgi:hypothetical protein